uniref:tRNA/rRNA methyltransferase SpoU type domain-containing protein n=1 Tax=Davidia involucrata TaxID=16924 RepID=A0A5B7BTD9_DAVIN
MSSCKTLVRTSISCVECGRRSNNRRTFSSLSLRHLRSTSASNSCNLWFSSLLCRNRGERLEPYGVPSRPYGCIGGTVPLETTDCTGETVTQNLTLEPPDDSSRDTVEEMLSNADDVSSLMKMERRPEVHNGDQFAQPNRWFPYLDMFKAGSTVLSSGEVLEALGPYIMDVRRERFRNVVKNRSYSVCLVVEGLSDFGNVSAALRSADALGFQSVHVVSCDSSKRYRGNRHVSMGAEKWLDIELWDSTQECFKVLKSRGYRIATTHVGMDAVSIYDMDWSCPTAIVVGNENRGISEEALELSDLHCSIPMKGMVDSFNVSVAAGILMHHAICDRTSRLGCHGDLTLEESQILLAEFSLRHSKSAISIAHEYAKRKAAKPISKL